LAQKTGLYELERKNEIVFIIHTVPFPDCIIPSEKLSPFDAYEGSIKIGEIIKTIADKKDIRIICGHHHGKLFLQKDNIKIYCSPFGRLE